MTNDQPKLSLGFSPCPNDCFIFDAMIHGKFDTEGLLFDVVMDDVETLNRRAFSALDKKNNSALDITKLSYHSYAYLTNPYVLLDAGRALGNNCGPLLISKNEYSLSDVSNLRIAIPGKYTTANFLLSLAFPDATHKTEMVFSGIENAVLSNHVDAGLIIHENRFTYQQKGLKKIIDLGEFWETLTHNPIPLGGIVMKRNFPEDLKQKINRIIRKSVEFAFANPHESVDFVKQHAQEMSEAVRQQHIALYVNEYSIDLGTKGRDAVQLLFNKAQQLNVISKIEHEIFLTK